MKSPSVLVLVAAISAGMVACGGSDSNTSVDSAYVAATPSYDLVALSVDDSDADAPSSASVTSELTVAQPGANDLGADACHPHLFSRTRQVVLNLNILSYKLLEHVADVIQATASKPSGATYTWERTGAAGIQRKFSLTKNGDGSFAFELGFAAAGSTTFVTVFSGQLVHTAASAADAGTAVLAETKGTMSFDYSALASIVSSEKESGQIAYAFDRVVDPSKPGKGVKKSETITFTNFMFGPNDPHGARNGSYSFVGEPGNGGTLTYQDSLSLLCPANPSGLDASTVTEARWYIDPAGKIHGRADAKATAGQIPTGDTFVGVTCHTGPAPTAADENGYWMMKLEDASGATVQGSSHEDSSGAPTCDAAFGPVPALANNATDWTFGEALTFPNEW